jgi:signal transduction histidine kinase
VQQTNYKNQSIFQRFAYRLAIDRKSRSLFSLIVVNLAFIGFSLVFLLRDLLVLLTDGDIFITVTSRITLMLFLSVASIVIGRKNTKLGIYITCFIPVIILYVYPLLFIPEQVVNEILLINIMALYLACTVPFILFNIRKDKVAIVILNVLIFLVHLGIQYRTVYHIVPVTTDLVIYFQNNYVILLLFQFCVWQFFFWLLYATYDKNERYQNALKQYNLTVHDQKNEIEAQNEELKQQQEQISTVNERLEQLVEERTAKLNNLNSKLIEYAYVNSHLLRAPLCRIQGLRNLIKFDPDNALEYQAYLDQSFDELNEIIGSISDILEEKDPEILKEIQQRLKQ